MQSDGGEAINYTKAFTEYVRSSGRNVYELHPLNSAKIYFDFTGVVPKFKYNEHYAIKIESYRYGKWEALALPEYFSTENDGITEKRTHLEIRLFNYKKDVVYYRVSIELYHGLFLPFFRELEGKVAIQTYSANR